MSPLCRAIRQAAVVYGDTRDKSGEPGILHPLRVMMAMHDDEHRVVAVLHDLLEDWPGWTLEALRQSYRPHIVDAIDAITRRKDEVYMDYIRRCGANEIARMVKLADLRDNMDRCSTMRPEHVSLFARYAKARNYLEALYMAELGVDAAT